MWLTKPPAYMTTDTTDALADFQKAMREGGRKLLATSAATAREADIAVDTKFVFLEVVAQRICDAIIEEAKRWPADLIVIGTHGRHGFSHLLLGSVAEGVSRLATKPALVIRGSRTIPSAVASGCLNESEDRYERD